MKKKKPTRYPWQQWLRQSKFCLVRGTDYHCEPYIMAQQVRNAANRARVHVGIRITGRTLTIVRRAA